MSISDYIGSTIGAQPPVSETYGGNVANMYYSQAMKHAEKHLTETEKWRLDNYLRNGLDLSTQAYIAPKQYKFDHDPWVIYGAN